MATGAASRIALGASVIGGMLFAMFLMIFFVRLFFVLISALFEDRKRRKVSGNARDTARCGSEVGMFADHSIAALLPRSGS